MSVVILDPARACAVEASVLVLSSSSRQSSPTRAQRQVQSACRWLQQRRAALIYKKMDSTLHGNITTEVQALRRAAGFETALICPANPAQGRLVEAGRLFVHGVDRGPLRERLKLSPQTTLDPPLPTVAEVRLPLSSSDLRRALDRSSPVLADATNARHLAKLFAITLSCRRKLLLAGSAGMAAALARRLARCDRARRRLPHRSKILGFKANQPFIVFSGSQN